MKLKHFRAQTNPAFKDVLISCNKKNGIQTTTQKMSCSCFARKMVVVITFTITLHKKYTYFIFHINDINYFKVLIYGHIFAIHVCVKQQQQHKLYNIILRKFNSFFVSLLDSFL